ncbi:MAG TPA: translation initiation factor IF-2 N-terminal domain-containing protein, partial [Xanthobacteraceae bacterium]
MVETTKNPGDKTLSVTPTKTLTLKPRGVEQGIVKQSFSHGRTKAVVVEKVKRRVGGPIRAEAAPSTTDGLTAKRSATARPAMVPPAAAPATAPAQVPAAPAPKPSGVVLRTLTEDEQKARVHALADARLREAEERKIAEEEAHIRLAREASERTERDAAEARKRGEEDRRRHDDETKRKAELEAKKRFGEDAAAAARPAARPVLEADEEEAPRTTRRGGVIRPAVAAKPVRPTAEKSRRRLTVVTALSADEVRERSVASFRRRVQRMAGHRDTEPKEKLLREVIIPETITIQELANRMAERGVDVIRLLMRQGQMVKITDVIDADTAQLLAEEMGHTVK